MSTRPHLREWRRKRLKDIPRYMFSLANDRVTGLGVVRSEIDASHGAKSAVSWLGSA